MSDPMPNPSDDQPKPQATVADAGPATKSLSIEVPEDLIRMKLQENYQSLHDEAAIPGFRRGHAPMKLLEKRFGSEIRKEVCNQLVNEGYQHAVEEHDLRVLGEPDIKDLDTIELPESGPMRYEVQVEVAPDVALPDMKDVEIKKPAIEVDNTRIDGEIERYGEMYGQFKPADQAQAEDYITTDLTVRVGDEPVEQNSGVKIYVPGEKRKFKGVVAGIVIQDLGKQLAGCKLGDTIELSATGPSGHENEKMRDQPVAITLRVTGIERLTPLTPQQLFEAMGMESESELRDQIRQHAEQQARQAQHQAMSQQIVDHLLEHVSIELPEKLSSQQAERIVQHRAMEMMYRGTPQHEIEQQLAEFRAASQEQAQRELKSLFILDEVARQFEVQVDESQVNGHVVQMAAQQGRRPERMREEMAANGQLNQLFVQLREQKAVDKLIEQVKIVEVSEAEWKKLQGVKDDQPRNKTTKKKTTNKKTPTQETGGTDAD